jgi:hypothetical protein
LFDDPLRAATERVGAIVTGKPAAEVVARAAEPIIRDGLAAAEPSHAKVGNR